MKCCPIFPVVLALPLVSCTLGPDFHLPELPGSGKWKETQPSTAKRLPDAWWRIFDDSDLNRLVDRALAANSDLAAAKARVDTARALVGVERARLFPQLGLTGANGISRASQDATYERIPMALPIDLESVRYRSSFDLSYDPDLWGRNRRLNEAADAQAAASEALFDAQRLGVATEVARQYFLLRGLDVQKSVLDDTIRSRSDALAIQQSKTDAGLSDGLATSRARTELELARNDLEAVSRQRGAAEHALGVLCGSRPADFSMPQQSRTTATDLPLFQAGLPAEVLSRRPDVRAAEQQLRAANARIGVAEAAFYPNFSLSGSAGFESVDLKRFLDWENRVLSLGAGVAAPIFDAGSNRANFQAAIARRDESLAQYRTTLLTALREVEDALVDSKSLANSRDILEKANASARETQKLAQERYDKGLTPYLEVVDAERTVLQTRLMLSQLDAQQRITLAVLAKSLGGGWKPGKVE